MSSTKSGLNFINFIVLSLEPVAIKFPFVFQAVQ